MRVLVFLVLFTFSFSSSGQDKSELDRRKGFKDIKLATNVHNYSLEFEKDIEDEKFEEAKLYSRQKGTYEWIGDIEIRDLEVKTYNDLIYEIIVTTKKEPRLGEALKKAFGRPQYDLRSESYIWKTEKLILYYRSIGSDKIQMRYYSFEVETRQEQDKKKEIVELSDEF